MKKVLLGTSAIALAGAFASQASAAEWQVRVGGYMEQYAAYADNDVDVLEPNFTDADDDGSVDDFDGTFTDLSGGEFDGIDSKQDAEIHFLPKITLDNGIEIGADIQLEGNTSGDQIDESHMRIKGSFGEVLLGSENSAGYKMTYAAPDVTFVNVNSGSLTAFVPFSGDGVADDFFRGPMGTTFIENRGPGSNNDAQRFTYFTPRFAGLQVGASYARDGNQDSNAQVDEDAELSDIVDIGANYVNSFGAFNVAVSGRWGTADAAKGEGPDPDIWSAGANLGYAGFTIGGSYAEQNDADDDNGEGWDAGVSYETGPWGFSFTWFHGEGNDDECGLGAPVVCVGDGEEENDQFLVGINYALAKGVDLGAFGAYVDYESARFSTDGGDTTDENEVEGWVVGTEMRIRF